MEPQVLYCFVFCINGHGTSRCCRILLKEVVNKMNQKEALKLAIETKFPIRGHYDESGATPEELERLVEATIEHCAKVCDGMIEFTKCFLSVIMWKMLV